jgi:hypothetical protein
MEKKLLKDLEESHNDTVPERPLASLVFFNAIIAKVIGFSEFAAKGRRSISMYCIRSTGGRNLPAPC